MKALIFLAVLVALALPVHLGENGTRRLAFTDAVADVNLVECCQEVDGITGRTCCWLAMVIDGWWN